eukprot:m.647275 g.647275  ORF g.647275 m.647275 type:complete len:625 (+) comp22656_c0_seq13:316-2190(+)
MRSDGDGMLERPTVYYLVWKLIVGGFFTPHRAAEEQREELLRKSVLVLIKDHLEREGYTRTSEELDAECGANLNKFEACDNIDLLTCIKEYQSYYEIKFKRAPKLTKRIKGDNGGSTVSSSPSRPRNLTNRKRANPRSAPQSNRDNGTIDGMPTSPLVGRRRASSIGNGTQTPLPSISSHGGGSSTTTGTPQGATGSNSSGAPPRTVASGGSRASNKSTPLKPGHDTGSAGGIADAAIDDAVNGLALSGAGIAADGPGGRKRPAKKGMPQVVDYRKELERAIRGPSDDPKPYNYHDDHLPKPLTGFGSNYTGEMATLAQVISRDIYVNNPDVKWDDLIGLESAKKVMLEAVVYPIRYPELFRGILSPWKGLLLFGPPGTGKTMLAKAVATECETTFFNISASSIVSKWRGDSEKLVRVLFELARYHAPSTIFLDEIDSIMSQRGSSAGGSGDHEGSRRMKTELLVQMDGLNKSDDLVFLLAASNLPWELDPAMLRRLEKRILVDLPTADARAKMFQAHLPPMVIDGVVQLKADIESTELAALSEGYSGSDIRLVCKEAAMRPLRKVFRVLEGDGSGGDRANFIQKIKLDPVTMEDVKEAIATTKASAVTLQGKYQKWKDEFEST